MPILLLANRTALSLERGNEPGRRLDTSLAAAVLRTSPTPATSRSGPDRPAALPAELAERLCPTLFIEFNLRSLSASGSVPFEIEDSVTGEVWESTEQGWSAATAAGAKVLRTSSEFGTKARLRLEVSGSSGTSTKVAVLRIAVSGKPF